MTLNIYLVRHGRTEWNEASRLQGTGDSPLTELGVENAKRTGAALKGIPFQACYSSLLKRAIDTANYIIAERDIPHFHHQGLNELHFGLWEGEKSADLRPLPEYQLMKTQPQRYKAEVNQGETMATLAHRVKKAFDEIVRQHPQGRNILIVSHGMTLTMLIALLLGIEWYDFLNEEKQPFIKNTAISHLQLTSDQVQVIALNQQDHLIS